MVGERERRGQDRDQMRQGREGQRQREREGEIVYECMYAFVLS